MRNARWVPVADVFTEERFGGNPLAVVLDADALDGARMQVQPVRDGVLGFENHRPTKYTAGNAFAFVPVASLDAIAKVHVAQAHWELALKGQGLTGMFLYCRQTLHTASSFHARMFAPDFGVPEGPATGSAAAFAGAVHRFDALPDGTHGRVIEQGYEMGRPSTIALTMEVERGELAVVRIGGRAVRVAEGRIEV